MSGAAATTGAQASTGAPAVTPTPAATPGSQVTPTPAAGAAAPAPAPPAAPPATGTATPPLGTPPAAPAAAPATGTPAPPAVPAVPDKYQLALGQGSLLDAGSLERMSATARDMGLTQENAQKALTFVESEVAARHNAYLESIKPNGAEWLRTVKGFEAESLADPKIANGSVESLKEFKMRADRAASKLFSPEVVQFLNATGLAWKRELLMNLADLDARMADDKFFTPPATPRPTTLKSDAEVFFGPSKK